MKQQGVLWEKNGFRMTPAGLQVIGEPTSKQWGAAVQSITEMQSAARWTTGDLLAYAETRGWSDDTVEAVMDATGLKRGTLLNYRLVSRAFPIDRRHAELAWSHYALLTSLASADADDLLAQSLAHKWGWAELRSHATEARQSGAREKQVFPAGTYGLLLAQVPWRSLECPQALDADMVAAMAPQVQAITAPDAVLYLPTANAQLDDALTVLRAWGFSLRGHHVIVHDLTAYTTNLMRERHKLVLVGVRGRPVQPQNVPDSVIGVHESVAEVIDNAYEAAIPRVLLFADEPRDGWTIWNQTVPEVDPARGILVRAEQAEAPVEATV